MNVIVLQVFVSLMLVAGSIVLFVFTVRSSTLDHSDRLSLAPLEDDARSIADAREVKVPSTLADAQPLSPARGPGES